MHYPSVRDLYPVENWTLRDVSITQPVQNKDGTWGEETVFFQKDVLAPDFWTDRALKVVVPKYFRGKVNPDGTPANGRETSVAQIIDRVVDTVAGWAGFAFDSSNGEELEFVQELVDRYQFETRISANGKDVAFKRPNETDLRYEEVYFSSAASWQQWVQRLKGDLLHQRVSFNSPVWFNVGVETHPQCSACFILRLEDYMIGPTGKDFDLDDHGLLAAQVKEGIIFSRGSGSGINLSRVRSKKEWITSGGRPTGPGSFARGLDIWAASIKSGGKTRRAAKMLILNIDHPDIEDFIRTKADEEQIAGILLNTGKYGAGMDSEAYAHAFHQNSNLSVRVSNKFMEACLARDDWDLISITSHFLEDKPIAKSMLGNDGRVIETVKAHGLLRLVAQKAWECADPGIQFHDTINKWHTCADEEPIFGSNPCSEYMFLDETSCNLASINLLKYFENVEDFNNPDKVEDFGKSICDLTIAMDAIVSGSRYPTQNIKRMTRRYRTLGVGFTNLGAMLMGMGIPYDSPEARNIAAACMSAITANTYVTSNYLATVLAPFEAFPVNKGSCCRVMAMHRDAHRTLSKEFNSLLTTATNSTWDFVVAQTAQSGLRNAQASVIAPTGTISFMMDCQTTGIEPEFALKKTKNLSGGGTLSLPNPIWEKTLRMFGYSDDVIKRVESSIEKTKDIEPGIIDEAHRKVFQTAAGVNALDWRAHVLMMAAVQPFVSGAISKTVNLPSDVSVDDIYDVYTAAWSVGLKAVAVYRDSSKFVQALDTGISKTELSDTDTSIEIDRLTRQLTEATSRLTELEGFLKGDSISVRRRAPKRVYHERSKFEIDGNEGYLFVGFYENGLDPCEVFVNGLSQIGSSIRGFMDAFCILFSWCMQYGVPLEKLLTRFEHTDFAPKGITGDDDVRICRSLLDFMVRKIKSVVGRRRNVGVPAPAAVADRSTAVRETSNTETETHASAGTTCRRCGSVNVKIHGVCTYCFDCGDESGGCFG